jgi:hypothetical protein
MVEIIKHTFGLCGESHPSLICMLGIGPIFLVFKTYILTIGSMVSSSIKLVLKQAYKFLNLN